MNNLELDEYWTPTAWRRPLPDGGEVTITRTPIAYQVTVNGEVITTTPTLHEAMAAAGDVAREQIEATWTAPERGNQDRENASAIDHRATFMTCPV